MAGILHVVSPDMQNRRLTSWASRVEERIGYPSTSPRYTSKYRSPWRSQEKSSRMAFCCSFRHASGWEW